MTVSTLLVANRTPRMTHKYTHTQINYINDQWITFKIFLLLCTNTDGNGTSGVSPRLNFTVSAVTWQETSTLNVPGEPNSTSLRL